MSTDVATWDRLLLWERLRRRHEPLDFRRWKRASQRHLRARFPGEGVRVLDATAGLGDHSVNLAELGFEVTAGDASAVAREATREAAALAGVSVEVLELRWERVGDERPVGFDLVFHDAIHWIEQPREMARALGSIRRALRPGGALVFFFADPRDPGEGAGMRVRAWDLAHLPREELVFRVEAEGVVHTHEVTRRPVDDVIEERHVFSTRQGDALVAREEATLRRVYRWDFAAMRAACAEAGFRRLDGELFENDHGHETAICFARV